MNATGNLLVFIGFLILLRQIHPGLLRMKTSHQVSTAEI
jgi:hypothetical protein